MNISAFVITLERAVERRPHAKWIETNVPLPCVAISAVDGAAMTEDVVASLYTRQIHEPRYPHALRRGEIGCFLSHRKAWQAIVDQDLEAALILEDDVTFEAERLHEAIEFVLENMVAGDYIQFQVRDIDSPHSVVVRNENHSLIQPRPALLRTTAQIVTRAAAERLLALTRHIDRPVDALLQMTWITGVPVKIVLPRVVSEISQQIGGSTLGGNGRPWHEKLRREILRPIYRTRIRLRARRAA
jgi:glycosyl transferase, family 25